MNPIPIETGLVFHCEDMELPGILHTGASDATRGVLVVVGGPQHRVGSHRQFILLARSLAQAGIPVLRFDYRGMGDASGAFAGFENIDADIHAALDAFSQQLPQLREIVIWGLCDAASAALFYAWRDPRVSGLVLLNPWARTEAGQARAYLRHYYLSRLISPDLWRKIWRGDFAFSAAWRSLRTMLGQARQSNADKAVAATSEQAPLPQRMTDGWQRFQGPILLILSGDDLTAAEFRDLARASRTWRRLLAQPRVTLHEYPEANHTFSCHEWRDQVATWTREWLGTW